MEITDVVKVPKVGFEQVLEVVERELEARASAREAYRGWGNRRKVERINGRDLDLADWYEAAKAA